MSVSCVSVSMLEADSVQEQPTRLAIAQGRGGRGAAGRGRPDPFPRRVYARCAPGWSPAAEEQRAGAAWSGDPSRCPPPAASLSQLNRLGGILTGDLLQPFIEPPSMRL